MGMGLIRQLPGSKLRARGALAVIAVMLLAAICALLTASCGAGPTHAEKSAPPTPIPAQPSYDATVIGTGVLGLNIRAQPRITVHLVVTVPNGYEPYVVGGGIHADGTTW